MPAHSRAGDLPKWALRHARRLARFLMRHECTLGPWTDQDLQERRAGAARASTSRSSRAISSRCSGPNGAGKTTLIGIITSLVNKTAGEARVFGHDIDRELEAAKACIGVVPQELNFNMFETPYTIVVNQAGFYGIPRAGGARAAPRST